MTGRWPVIHALLATAATIAGCGGPRFDAAATPTCEDFARTMPGSRVTTAFVVTLGRIRDGGYALVKGADPWIDVDDGVPVTVCAVDTPSVGGPGSPSRFVVAMTDAATGIRMLDFGPADTLPLPTP